MTLAPGHREELRRSGLSDETIARAGIHSAPEHGVREILGYGAGPGMVIPYPSLNGGPRYARVKLDHAGPDGKRYRSPKEQPNRLYIPPLLDQAILADPSTPLWVTEGEKKCLKATQEGLPCVALPGVWSWKTRDAQDRSLPIPDLDLITWRGRTVYVVFDSDLAEKATVKLAEFRLTQELRRRGARVLALRLPGGPNGEKIGLDDFLVRHSVESLCALAPVEIHHPALRSGPTPIEAHALLQREYAEPPAIVGGGILPRQTLGVTGGAPKLGKSCLILNLALHRAIGHPWLGFDTTPGRSLLLQAEIPERELQTRLRLMLQDLGEPFPEDRLFFVTHRGFRLDRSDGLQACRKLIEDARPDLLIVDPLARFFSGDENSAREVGRLIGSLDDLIQSYQLAVLLVHHTSKPVAAEPREGGLKLRGSSALFGAADTVMVLDKAAGGLFRLSFELRHGREPEAMLLERTDHLWFLPAGPPEDLLAVASIVVDMGLRWTALVGTVQEDQKTSRRTAERLVTRTKSAGLLAQDESGLYRATATYRQMRDGGEQNAHG